MSTLSPQDQDYIRGLLAERAGYLQAKKKDRAAAVDAELARVGYVDKTDAPVAERLETATIDPVSERAVTKRRPSVEDKP
jgi:hypothetical protein